MHRPGPRFNFADRDDQRGYIAVEWWPDDLLAIQFASARGVTVVEAAGNGAEDLDDALYDRPGPGLVTTTGYGDLFGAQIDEDFWFTDEFSGTSSASPIVTGVVAALQGIAKSNGSSLTPKQVRGLLRAHGSPQTDGPERPMTQRIGLRPDLRKLVPALQGVA